MNKYAYPKTKRDGKSIAEQARSAGLSVSAFRRRLTESNEKRKDELIRCGVYKG